MDMLSETDPAAFDEIPEFVLILVVMDMLSEMLMVFHLDLQLQVLILVVMDMLSEKRASGSNKYPVCLNPCCNGYAL